MFLQVRSTHVAVALFTILVLSSFVALAASVLSTGVWFIGMIVTTFVLALFLSRDEKRV